MKMKVHFLINNCIYILIIGRFINISNKSTKTSIQIQLYTIAKKKERKIRQELHIAKIIIINRQRTEKIYIYI